MSDPKGQDPKATSVADEANPRAEGAPFGVVGAEPQEANPRAEGAPFGVVGAEPQEELDPEALAAMEEEAPALSALLKRSLDANKATEAEKVSDDEKQKQLLAGVQRKLRD